MLGSASLAPLLIRLYGSCSIPKWLIVVNTFVHNSTYRPAGSLHESRGLHINPDIHVGEPGKQQPAVQSLSPASRNGGFDLENPNPKGPSTE